VGSRTCRRVGSRLLKAAGVIGVLLLIASCSDGPGSTSADDAGPLEHGTDTATACHPKRDHSHFILGAESLTNAGSTPVTIDSITIADPTNLAEDDAYVSPVPSVGPSTLMGIVDGPPPKFYAKGQARLWNHRRPAVGSQVPPARAGTDLNMLVVVHSPDLSTESEFRHLVVTYHDASHEYTWTGVVSYRLVPGSSCG
jgi:hypothetical protein